MSLKILGLESSCDDSSASVINCSHEILSNVIISQNSEHAPFGGVVPEIAARTHLTNLKLALDMCLKESDLSLEQIDVVASTAGPGLIGGLIVSTMFAKSLSSVFSIPFIPINHLEAHALTARLTSKLEFPYLLLLASGGHCQFVAVLGLGRYKILGKTLDDSVGEAFDKVAKMMNLGFPGGPIIENLAKKGEDRFTFPKPLCNRKNSDMSFSGLKTAVKLKIGEFNQLSKKNIADIASSFQRTICEILSIKIKYAMKEYERLCSKKTIVVAGGVASNLAIRKEISNIAKDFKYDFIAPPVKLCTDNAAMVAFAGLEYFNAGKIGNINFKPRARWSLEELS